MWTDPAKVGSSSFDAGIDKQGSYRWPSAARGCTREQPSLRRFLLPQGSLNSSPYLAFLFDLPPPSIGSDYHCFWLVCLVSAAHVREKARRMRPLDSWSLWYIYFSHLFLPSSFRSPSSSFSPSPSSYPSPRHPSSAQAELLHYFEHNSAWYSEDNPCPLIYSAGRPAASAQGL